MRVSLKNKGLAAQPSLQGTYCLSKHKFHGVESWTSFKDKKSASILIDKLLGTMQASGFFLKKWVSTAPELIAHLPKELLKPQNQEIEFVDETQKALGIIWAPTFDTFMFNAIVILP